MEVIACGICLNMDVKMDKLRGYPLEVYYKHIIGNVSETNISHYFQYACYECACLIKKYHLFREKCLRGQSVLYKMLKEKRQITKADLKSVDRKKLQLCSNLAYGCNNIHKIEQADIKQECGIKDISEMVETNIIEANEIKIEHDFKEDDDEIMSLDFDDNEHSFTIPVEKQDSPKRFKIKKNRKKLKNSYEKPKQKENLEENSTDDTSKENSETQKTKPGPKQNRNGLTPEEMSMADHVQVIKLTLEEQLEEVTKRQKTSNYMNSEYKCDLCYKGFIDPDAFGHHMKRHDPANASNVCPICKICFQTNRALYRHRMNHDKNYICKECSYICKTLTQAKQHQNDHKGKIYKCEICGNITTKWSSHLTHTRIKHPSEFICDACGFSFVSKLGLGKHKTMMHKNENESESSSIQTTRYCKVCDLHCNSQQKWKRHMASITHKIKTTNDFTCEICKETFTTGEDLRWHHRRLHPMRHGRNKKNQSAPKVWPTNATKRYQARASTTTTSENHILTNSIQ